MDQILDEIEQHPQIHVEDTPRFYDMEVFNRCSQTMNAMLTLECWRDVHPSLVTIPMDWDHLIPFGLLYAREPSEDIIKFLDAVKEFQKF